MRKKLTIKKKEGQATTWTGLHRDTIDVPLVWGGWSLAVGDLAVKGLRVARLSGCMEGAFVWASLVMVEFISTYYSLGDSMLTVSVFPVVSSTT